MKILEVCPYSAGICGVWNRVKEESIRLARKHEVMVVSSDRVKGSSERAERAEKIGKVKVRRFSALKLGGESFMYWKFDEQVREFNPDLIIAHNYRHLHTDQALRLGLKIHKPVFIVTHAPFVDKNTTRTVFGAMAVTLYDIFIGPKQLKNFSKIIAISKWEIPFLHKLQVPANKIVHISNGIPEEFFTEKIKNGKENSILYLGRISSIKNIETIIEAIALLKHINLKLDIVGPAEISYLKKLKKIVLKLGVENKVEFKDRVNDLKEKIKIIDAHRLFILASKREGMPQSLIEAMARKRVVIASNTPGTRDIIKDGKNGYLFDMGNSTELAKIISKCLKNKKSKLTERARNDVEQYSWDKIIKKIEEII